MSETKAVTNVPTTETKKTGRSRGFAAMDRSKVSEIASKGGKAAHATGKAHQFTSDEAKAAGKKGGNAPHVSRGGVRKPKGDAILPSDVVDGKVATTDAPVQE